MRDISSIELGRQLMKPNGDFGLQVGENMNSSNNSIYDFVLSQLDIVSDSEILEIGFGNGKFISKYFKINPNIRFSAIDFSEIMCSEAKLINKDLINDNKLVIKCEDSLSMSFSKDSFDIVVTINTVYFWGHIEAQLEEIKRTMKTGGLLFIGYRPKSVMKDLPFAQEVFMLYDSEDLQLIVQRQGFKIVKEESQTTQRKSVDGSVIHTTDICLIVEKE
jgi:ubiquinone/menaquinone biosynthesis C-methylase UbiE